MPGARRRGGAIADISLQKAAKKEPGEAARRNGPKRVVNTVRAVLTGTAGQRFDLAAFPRPGLT
jgi:hypothetical protein